MSTPHALAPTRLPPRQRRRVRAAVLGAVLVGIALAAAWPAYDEYRRRAQREAAREGLLRIAAAQERFLFEFGRYAAHIDAPRAADSDASGLGVPASTKENADDRAYYDFAVRLRDGGLAYRLTATPRGAQLADDRCGALVLDQSGQRRAASGDCW